MKRGPWINKGRVNSTTSTATLQILSSTESWWQLNWGKQARGVSGMVSNTWFAGVWCHSICDVPAIIMSRSSPLRSLLGPPASLQDKGISSNHCSSHRASHLPGHVSVTGVTTVQYRWKCLQLIRLDRTYADTLMRLPSRRCLRCCLLHGCLFCCLWQKIYCFIKCWK